MDSKTFSHLFNWDNGGPWGNARKPSTPRSTRPSSGGGRPPQPELEDVMNKLTENLRGMWKNDGGDTNWRWFVLAAVAVWLASGLYIVAPEQQGVVQRFGAYAYTTDSGLHYHLPWPVETVTKPNVTRENIVQIGFRSGEYGGNRDVEAESMMLTGDENIVDLDFTVRWKVADARNYLFNVFDVDETVASVAESVMRETIGRHPIDDALADNKLAIQEETQKHLQAVLDYYKAGVLITGVDLQQVNPPAEVVEAFRDVQAARADAEKVINESKGYANRILPLARGQAAQLLEDAAGYKAATVARAEGEASRFRAQVGPYKQAPDVTRERLYMDAMEEVLAGKPKVVVTGKGGGNLLPFIPLDKLLDTKPKAEAGR
ncbi:MAG: FtsH protease activity modulator HflK [Pseudomonadaceae bacterium]|nr:FtsH protease activity modulator HflK [Pseudomonadaceae bacterium]